MDSQTICTIRMRSQNNESDEEYLDDPIKLFDSELERVHFGSQSQGNINSDNFYEPEHIESDNDVSEELLSDSEYSQEREYLPSYIKLVDCAKFPWYYKRYTQQIIDKTSIIYDLVSDSDSEISGEHITDNKDGCIIVEEMSESDMVNKSEETSSKPRDTNALPLYVSKKIEKNRLERMKRREDFELQKALSQKCTVNVDFKQNIGLIGMTIKQKFVKDISSESATPKVNKTKISKVKEKKNPSYIKAVEKALNNVGTELEKAEELLVVPDDAENTKKDKSPRDVHTRHEANDLGENFPVKFNLGDEISEKLLQRIKEKKRHNKCQIIKHQDNRLDTVNNKPKSGPNLSKPLKLSSYANKELGSRNIKNIEKTNRFKNIKAKALESMLLHLLTKPNKKEVVIDSKKVEEGMNIDQNLPKSTDNRREPNSPILPCTLAKKNRNTNDNIKALENIENQAVNKSVIGSLDTKSVTKTTKQGTINVISTMSRSQVTTKKDTKKLLPKSKNSDQLNKPEAHEVSNVSISDIKILPHNHTNITPTTQNISVSHNNLSTINTVPSQTNLTSVVPNSKYNNVVPIVSNNCVVTSNQSVNAEPNISNNITSSSSTNVIISQCDPVTTANNNRITIFTKDQKRLPGGPGPGNELNCNNLTNHNSGPYNSCSSAIILRPPRPNDFISRVRPIHPGQYGLEIQKRPYQMQPRFYHNPYRTNYTPPHNRNQRFDPRLANCIHANYRFPPPPPPSPENGCKSLHDPSKYHSNMSWYMPKMYPEWGPRPHQHPRNPFPARLPISVLQRPSTTVSAKLGYVSQPMDTGPEINRIQQDQCSQIPNSLGDWRDKQILDPRLVTQDNKDITVNNFASEASSDLITTKSKMLELLESATNELKRGINEDNNITKDNLLNTFKLPKISKLETVTDDYYSKQVDQQKGYSPPILPIPTFKNVLDQAKIDTQSQDKQIVKIVPPINYNGIKNTNVLNKKNAKTQESTAKGKEKPKNKSNDRKYINDCNKRAASVKSHKYGKKEDIKKISLEEYKKRTIAHQSGDSDKIKYRDKSNMNRQRWAVPNKPKSKVNRFSTESDLGYDSDSTVIL